MSISQRKGLATQEYVSTTNWVDPNVNTATQISLLKKYGLPYAALHTHET